MNYLTKWYNAINGKFIQASVRAGMMDKKTMALLSMVGILGVAGFSMALDANPANFVTCDGARKIALYSRPLAIFLTVIILIVGVAGAAFEGFQKKYGHFIGVLLIAIVVAAILYSAGIFLGNYGNELALALCGQAQ
jgi:hypothetical protein